MYRRGAEGQRVVEVRAGRGGWRGGGSVKGG